MDLRNLSQTPNPTDQRRTSLSSMSSTSGYASSTYGGNQGNVTPNLANSRMNQSRHFGNPNPAPNNQSSNVNLNLGWLNQNQQNLNLGPMQQQQPMLNVGPWIEQQAQQQQQQQSQPISNPMSPSQQQRLMGHQQQQAQQDDQSNDLLNDNDLDKDDDDLIPTAIVIKNIPFAIKKEQLLDVMTKLSLPLPYAFNYHFDNGVFRGLAFANFTSTDETSLVVNQLNGREIGGRKLRVEYKKMLPVAERERIEREKREKRGQLEEQHRTGSSNSLASMISVASAPAGINKLAAMAGLSPLTNHQPQAPLQAPNHLPTSQPPPQQQQAPPNPSSDQRVYMNIPMVGNLQMPPQNLDFNDPETLEVYGQLLLFRDDKDKSISELAYPSSLNMNQRKVVSILSSFMGLLDSFENGLIVIRRRPNFLDASNLMRSQSQNSLPMVNQQQSSRFSKQATPIQQQMSITNLPQAGRGQQNPMQLSSVALLRGNRSYADVRNAPMMYNSGSNLSNTNLQFQNLSQPTTPGNEMNRFPGLSGYSVPNMNMTPNNGNVPQEYYNENMFPSVASSDDSNDSNVETNNLVDQIGGLSLNLQPELNRSSSGIWGPK